MPAKTLPPIGASSAAADAGPRCSAGDRRDRRPTPNTAISSRIAAPNSKKIGDTCRASPAVTLDPTIAPIEAPAAIRPNSRLPCSDVNRSTFICQKTETTNKL